MLISEGKKGASLSSPSKIEGVPVRAGAYVFFGFHMLPPLSGYSPKIASKREQSDACISYVERKRFIQI